MSNLTDLYISQSFYGIVNFEDSTKPISSQSGEINFQDGVGQPLDLSINATTKEYTFKNTVHMNEDLFVSGTIHAYELVTLIESASTILSSGSNQLGDAMDDEQLLIGQTTISGSLTVVGPHSHTGDLDVTVSLFVSNEISSSTIAGLGNATEYSQSVDSSLNILSQSVDNTINTLSESLDLRLDLIEDYTSSLKTAITVDGTTTNLNGDLNGGTASFDTLNVRTLHTIIESSSVIFSSGSNQLGDELIDTQILSGSVFIPNLEFLNGNLVDTDTRIVQLETFSSSFDNIYVSNVEYSASIAEVTSSLISQINTKLDTGSYLIDSASFNTQIQSNSDDIFSLSQSIEITDSAQTVQINNILAITESFVREDRVNTFTELNTFESSVKGGIHELSVISQTASLDCSVGNFFKITLPSGSTELTATNIVGGETITLRVTQPSAGYGNLIYNNDSIKIPFATPIILTNQVNSEDVITFVSFDTGSLYGVASLNFI